MMYPDQRPFKQSTQNVKYAQSAMNTSPYIPGSTSSLSHRHHTPSNSKSSFYPDEYMDVHSGWYTDGVSLQCKKLSL